MQRACFGTRTLAVLVSVHLALGPQAVAFAQTIPAGVAPADSRTTLSSSANDTPVVNIATPNAAGVSHNRYDSYDVSEAGLILNNSAVDAVSLLGGGTPGNPNFGANQSASLILNEVVTVNPGSMLRGYQEILGPAAELVIANPWGVTCDGCGFINTPRVTLTTGVPTLRSNGALAGFTINGGLLAVTGAGLDASRQTALDLLARGISIDGNVVVGSETLSGDLQLLAGANDFDYDTRSASTIAGAGPLLPFAIDSSVLGGMYADRIRLLVTEEGAGVRTAGRLAAFGDDLTIDALGRIELRAAASAAGDVVIRGADVDVDLPDADTYLYAGRDLSVTASGSVVLGNGSLGADRNVELTAAGLLDTGSANDVRFTGASGVLTANVDGTLAIEGGYWTAPTLNLSGATAQIGAGTVLFGSGASGSALSVETSGLLSVDGQLYSNADASLSSQHLEVRENGVVAAEGGIDAVVARGSEGGLDNAGIIQGANVQLVAQGAGDGSATAFLNRASGGVYASGAVSIGEDGGASAVGSLLSNEGVIAGDLVTIDTSETRNLSGAIQAQTNLDLRSETLLNQGADALIIASANAAGSASIGASTITNSGVIWSAGGLTLNPVTLEQERDSGSAVNPLIGAGRDLTLHFANEANLGTGDLQAGRDLAIIGSSVSDAGSTGAGDTTPDLRYAGRNLSATGDGGNIDIGGGQWYSQGDLRLTGNEIFIGSRIDEISGLRTETSGVQLVGGGSGEGTLAAHARTGAVNLDADAAAFSGADLSIDQQTAFVLNESTTLQANGALSIAANGLIDNAGVIAGDRVSLTSNSATELIYRNRSTGALIGNSSIHLGTADRRAREITIENAAAGADAGVFGGGLSFHTDEFNNYGLIQAIGASEILAGDFYNDLTGRFLGFSNTTGAGGTTIRASSISNYGMLYDSSLLNLDANRISNESTGGIGSAGTVRLSSVGLGGTADLVDNLGEIWGDVVELDLLDGMINGRDPGVPENRLYPASIFASTRLVMNLAENAGLTNYGSIESAGDIEINNEGGGYLRNEMSMIPEVSWFVSNSTGTEQGDLGLLQTNPYGDTSDRDEVTIDGVDYYVFDETDGGSYAYRDTRRTYLNLQQLSVPAESIPRPSIRAQGDLRIDGFQSVVNTGATLGADGDVTITSATPGSSVSNDSLQLTNRDEIREVTARGRCETFADDPVNCHVLPDHVRSLTPFPSQTRYTNYRDGSVAFAGQIYAGGTLTIDVAGTVTNSSAPGQFSGIFPPGPSQVGFIGVTQPGAPGARGDVSTLLINGAQIPLPATANGRFVQGQDAGAGPLIESNPLFGLDSPYLGSEYLTDLLGLDPDQQTRRLGDDSYEAYLIQQQIKAASGRGVLESYYSAGDMLQALFDNAADESERLELGFGKALTQDQIASLQSDIVWMVEQEIEGEKVLVPVVYLADATRADFTRHSSLEGYDVDISAGTVRNVGAEITAKNLVSINSAGNIENVSGRVAGWNVRLDAEGDVVNSTLVKRIGDAENGADRAQRTAIIEAGNTAVITAGRDINVQGAWVAAGKDVALIAERNVSVESLALTTNSHSGDDENSYTRQTQTLQGAGVVAGGKIGIQGGENVRLTGADLAAGETVALRAERGDVNIGVRELTNSSTSVETRTGRYDQLERDPDAGTLGIGVGTEKKTTTRTTTTTTGVGSNISGSGVIVSTGAGDVSLIGSEINAGDDGVLIDSAGDVDILAYEDKFETTTTVKAVRGGVRIDGSYDGVFVGAQESGETTSDTTSQTTARTSGLASTGDIVIRGEGDVTNEGTRFDAAGDIALIGENVVNKAAQDTYTNTSDVEEWDSKQQVGFTANGTGSSIAGVAKGDSQQVTVNNLEAQMRVTGSYNDETQTYSETRAQTTQMNAGGNIIIAARNDASDEGTQYAAGKNIIIDAESYKNAAAADTRTSSSDQTRASGQLTGGLNSAAEVAVTASAEGSHDEADDSESTAQTGSLKAGGAVIINARSGDATFEGTQIDGQQGVGITAAGDINLKQANDTRTSSGSGESGSARLSGSVSVVGTGGSVGAGASGRTYENDESESTARTVSIRSGDGNLQLNAGRDIQSQGTTIEAGGNVALTATRDINLAAATDTSTKTGRADGGGADVNVGFGTGAAKGNGSVGGTVDFERSRTDYSETNERGSEISAGGQFSLNAGGDARLEGAQVDAGSAVLNTGGDLVLESAQRTVKDDSNSVTGRIDVSASKGGGAGGANSVGTGSSGTGKGGGGNAGGANAGVNVTKSYQDIETNTNATITTRGATTLDVGGDMTLAGANIDAQGGVSGNVAGDLNIESRVDKTVVDQSDVKAYAGVGAFGGTGGGNKFDRGQEATQVGANQVAQTGVFTDVNAQTKDNRTVGTASGISGGAGGIDVRVGGNTTLTGAANQATDFDTQGRTTVADVETRIDESSTDFRIAGTVASAAGSDQGKGGDYGLVLNAPGDKPKTARRRPNVPDNDAPAPSRPRSNSSNHAANEPNLARPNGQPRNNDAPARPRPIPPPQNANEPTSPGLSARPNDANVSNGAPRVVPDNDAYGVRIPVRDPQLTNNRNNDGLQLAAPVRPDNADFAAPSPARPDSNRSLNEDNYNNVPATRPDNNLRPANEDAYANNPQARPDGNSRPLEQDNYNNVPQTRPDNSSRPANEDAYANNPYARPDGDFRPTNEDAYANNPQARPDGEIQRGDTDAYQTSLQAPRSESDLRPLNEDSYANNPRAHQADGEEDAYQTEVQLQRPDREQDEDLYQTDARPPSSVDSATNNRVAMVLPANGSQVNRGAAQPPLTINDQVRLRIDADPQLQRLRDQGAWLDSNESAAYQRNLAEIDAFTSDGAGSNYRDDLLNRLERSVQGPQLRQDGLTEFPLRPQYVGENIQGFDNWNTRPRRQDVGQLYAHPDRYTEPTAIQYYTTEQQMQARVSVREDGSLGIAGQPISDGKWIFVVDADGNLVADQLRPGHIHHSSLSGGRPVLMAGEFEIVNGKISKVTNQSGHFRPDGESFRRFLAELRQSGADLSQATAPELRFETDERGRFTPIIVNDDLLTDPSTQHNSAGTMLGPLKAVEPSDNRTGWVNSASEYLALAA